MVGALIDSVQELPGGSFLSKSLRDGSLPVKAFGVRDVRGGGQHKVAAQHAAEKV